jgi:hypothetical protein
MSYGGEATAVIVPWEEAVERVRLPLVSKRGVKEREASAGEEGSDEEEKEGEVIRRESDGQMAMLMLEGPEKKVI